MPGSFGSWSSCSPCRRSPRARDRPPALGGSIPRPGSFLRRCRPARRPARSARFGPTRTTFPSR
ncbi:MAG: hypothetical protein DME09_19245 [Candidatus Rokuibacteriota bacterium]|nr:MAG: hypothetical protein DME09_19245 [Candidatus Rokubacteria bacterium]